MMRPRLELEHLVLPVLVGWACSTRPEVLLGKVIDQAGPGEAGVGGEGGGAGSDGASGGAGSGGGGSGGDSGSGGRAGDGASAGEGGSGAVVEPPDGGNDGCTKPSAEVALPPVLLQFVVDTSGSMLWGTDNNPETTPSKWELTKPAVVTGVSHMPEAFALGMNFYPNLSGSQPCIENRIALPLGWLTSEHRDAVGAALDTVAPMGGTPTHDAWQFGEEALKASVLEGTRAVVVITDGFPNFGKACSLPDTVAFSTEVAAALSVDAIRTFVVGTHGSQGGSAVGEIDGRPDLSRLAEAGGTAPRDGTGALACSHTGPTYCHIDLTASPDLERALAAALSDIATSAPTCTVRLPEPPPGTTPDPEELRVLYSPGNADPNDEPVVLPRTDWPCSEGWVFADASKTAFTLCSATCDVVRSDSKARLGVDYDCGGGHP